jgi:hypoxanthine-DNA glycosylase
MIETHPFGEFVPPQARYLILGSFTGKSVPIEPGYDWYYGTKRNQFWKIIERVYNVSLPTKEEKVKLFTKLHIAIADIIKQCERSKGSNLDNNLINIVYNFEALRDLLHQHKIVKVFFTSKFVELAFMKNINTASEFPYVQFITLPSPSPRYAALSFDRKVEIYKKLLPDIITA